MPNQSKTCNTCGEAKSLDAFNRQKDCRDGHRPQCKQCKAAEMKQRRDANLEHYRQKDRERYATDPKRRADTIARVKEARERDPEGTRERTRAYYLANPEVYERSRAKRNALKKNVEHQPYTRREIYDRDSGTCRGCTKTLPYEKGAFHIDHIVPISLGGPDTPANVQIMCPKCNRSKWAKLDGQIHLPV